MALRQRVTECHSRQIRIVAPDGNDGGSDDSRTSVKVRYERCRSDAPRLIDSIIGTAAPRRCVVSVSEELSDPRRQQGVSFAANEMMAVMVDGNPLPIAERCLYAAPHSKGHPSCPIVYVLEFSCCVLHVACRASEMIAVNVGANLLVATESQSVFTAVVPEVPRSTP